MGLRDVSGVFSREFIVGYFAPAFFITVVVAYSLDWLPDRFEKAGGSDQILLIGGVALLVALVLNGLRHPITSIYSGTRPADVIGLGTADVEFTATHSRPKRRIAGWTTRRLQHQFDELQQVIVAGGTDAREARKIRDSRLGSDRDQIAQRVSAPLAGRRSDTQESDGTSTRGTAGLGSNRCSRIPNSICAAMLPIKRSFLTAHS